MVVLRRILPLLLLLIAAGTLSATTPAGARRSTLRSGALVRVVEDSLALLRQRRASVAQSRRLLSCVFWTAGRSRRFCLDVFAARSDLQAFIELPAGPS